MSPVHLVLQPCRLRTVNRLSQKSHLECGGWQRRGEFRKRRWVEFYESKNEMKQLNASWPPFRLPSLSLKKKKNLSRSGLVAWKDCRFSPYSCGAISAPQMVREPCLQMCLDLCISKPALSKNRRFTKPGLKRAECDCLPGHCQPEQVAVIYILKLCVA